MTQKMNKFNSLKKTTKVDFATYLGVIVVFIITTILQNNGSLKRSAIGLLVPICCYMSMAVSLNLTVGILGELSLGHAGFILVMITPRTEDPRGRTEGSSRSPPHH